MHCQECADQASVHVTESRKRRPRVIHLCAEHAMAYARRSNLGWWVPHLLEKRTVVPVTVTQGQIDNEEAITVELPGGGTREQKLYKNMSDNWYIADVRQDEGSAEPLYEIHLRVVPE